jgi:predicted ATP-grasp superfamily ATP-dependent carboligase
LVIVGASVRAAAFSALRAGLRPWCADLFADVDLQRVAPVVPVQGQDYPEGLLEIVKQAPPVPWMYTGAMENRRDLVGRLTETRPLWGCDPAALALARNPWRVATCLREADLPCPDIRLVPVTGRWLIKPLAGAGGRGIAVWDGRQESLSRKKVYFQEMVEGLPCSAVYVGDNSGARLLGVTRQLIGEPWLHAGPFHYAGSVGPLSLGTAATTLFEWIGNALCRGCNLRGLFGVDCILRDGVPFPVEVNPRYTASVEILEHTTGLESLELHRTACMLSRSPQGRAGLRLAAKQGGDCNIVGKAILFARDPLTFPADGPWLAALDQPVTPLRDFADIPPAGSFIDRGRPILTLFARAASVEECLGELRRRAEILDRRLFGR